MTQTLLEQRQAAAEALRAADFQRATDYLAIVTSPEAQQLLADIQALYDPTEAEPQGSSPGINKVIGWVVSTLSNAPNAAQQQISALTPPPPAPQPPAIP